MQCVDLWCGGQQKLSNSSVVQKDTYEQIN